MDDDVLAVHSDVHVAPRPNLAVILHARIAPTPTQVPVTSVLAAVRDGSGAVLLTYVTGRGYDLPGGHIEPGEAPFAACVREVFEETGLALPEDGAAAELAATIFFEIAAPRPADFPYPHPRSQIWVYRFDVTAHRPPVQPSPGFECTHARWVRDDGVHPEVGYIRSLCGPRIWLPVLAHVSPPSIQ